MRALRSSPGVGAVSASSLRVVDDDEVGVAPGQPHLDVPGGQLGVERQRGVREDVEDAELERCRDGSGEALACRGRRLVAERGGRREVCLDCVNVPVDVHGSEYDIKMMSVKCEMEVIETSQLTVLIECAVQPPRSPAPGGVLLADCVAQLCCAPTRPE